MFFNIIYFFICESSIGKEEINFFSSVIFIYSPDNSGSSVKGSKVNSGFNLIKFFVLIKFFFLVKFHKFFYIKAYLFVKVLLFYYVHQYFLYNLAISGTNGSSGFGSDNSDDIDNKTFDIVNAGDHSVFKISIQILPFLLTLQ